MAWTSKLGASSPRSWDWLLSDGQGHVSTLPTKNRIGHAHFKLKTSIYIWIHLAGKELQDAADLLSCDFRSLKGLPVLVCLSSYDCMHDEGKALAKRLSESGAFLYQVEGRGSHAMAHIVDPECKAKTFEAFGLILQK